MQVLAKTYTSLSLTHSGYIAGSGDGIVTVAGKPASRNIWLFNAQTMAVEQVITSLKNGHYLFLGLDSNKKYLIMSRDHNNESQPYVWDNIIPSTDLTIDEQQTFWREAQSGTSLIQMSNTLPLIMEQRQSTNGFYGNDTLTSFVDGVENDSLVIVSLIFESATIDYDVTGNYTIENINMSSLKSIVVNGQIDNAYLNKLKGSISGNVNVSCDDTSFIIRCYREDGFFVGDYQITPNGDYNIPNLNVNSSYDILLHDNNRMVETLVNSRRIPIAY